MKIEEKHKQTSKIKKEYKKGDVSNFDDIIS